MADAGIARELLDAVIAAYAVLGGTMAYSSGAAAPQAQATGRPEAISESIGEGIADGFRMGIYFSLVALIIAVWG